MRRSLAAALVLLLPAGALRAQATAADSSHVEVAAATFIRDSLKAGDVRFESRPVYVTGVRPGNERSERRNLAIAAALRGTAAHQSDVLTCSGTPNTCSLLVAYFVAFREPVFCGDTATIGVETMSPTGLARIPIFSIEHEVMLVRSGIGWKVIRAKVVRVT